MMVIPCFLALFMALAGVSGTVGATTLTVAQLAAHGHDFTICRDDAGTGYVDTGSNQGGEYATQTSGSSASHTHSLTGVKSGSASSLPPYYALAYIMRCA